MYMQLQVAVVEKDAPKQRRKIDLPPSSPEAVSDTPLGWTNTAKGSPVFNIPGLAAPKVRILPGRIVDKVGCIAASVLRVLAFSLLLVDVCRRRVCAQPEKSRSCASVARHTRITTRRAT